MSTTHLFNPSDRSTDQEAARDHRGVRWILGALLLIMTSMPMAPTLAESSSQDPTTEATGFWGAITGDHIPLRCASSSAYYVVGEANTGDVVYVIEVNQDSGWARIQAPYGLTGFVRTRDLEIQGDATKATAPALCYGSYPDPQNPNQSWKKFTIEPDTTVSIIEALTLNGNDFLRIALPEYTPVSLTASFIRPASDEEVAAHQKNLASLKSTGEPIPPAQDEEPEQPQVDPANDDPVIPPRVDSNDDETTEKQPDDDAQTDEPTTADDVTTEPDNSADPAETTNDPADADTDADHPNEIINTDPISDPDDPTPSGETAEADPSTVTPLTLADLEALYEKLKILPVLEAEIAPVLTGYQNFSNDENQSSADRRRARAKIRLLEIRRDNQAARRRMKLALAEAEGSIQKALIANDSLAEQSGQFTTLVGKLTLSSVYDGNRLPLRYRLRDRITGRTVAYVPPVKKIDLGKFLTEEVRMIGAKSIDPALGVTIFKIKTISLLSDPVTNPTENETAAVDTEDNQ